jgi:spermidine/putrescine-binding protein
MKKTFTAAALVLAALVFSGCGNGKKQLTLYTWAEMFPPEILEGFEKQTGTRINYVNFDTGETMLARLQAAKGGDYDLIIADDYILKMLIDEKLAQKIDKSKIFNYANINPLYQKQFYDPDDAYTIPYGAGVQTIVYDPQRVNISITGYADLWNPSLENSVGVISSFRVINGMALKVLGQSYNTNDLDLINAAGEKLLQLAPNVRLIQDDHLEDQLISGEIAAAVMYTSQVTLAKMEKPELAVVFPTEGIGFGIMAACIPARAPNPLAALAFLDYILDAERGAACFEYIGYYSTYAASDSFIAPEYKPFLTLPDGFNVNMEMIQNVSPEAEEAHNLIWTKFKAAAGNN